MKEREEQQRREEVTAEDDEEMAERKRQEFMKKMEEEQPELFDEELDESDLEQDRKEYVFRCSCCEKLNEVPPKKPKKGDKPRGQSMEE